MLLQAGTDLGMHQENIIRWGVDLHNLGDVLSPVEESPLVMHTLRLFQSLREVMHPTVRLEHRLTLEVAIRVTEHIVAKHDGDGPTP